MKFEHLIQINDPAAPWLPTLSREQLWAGLMLRVEDPLPFLPGLERCDVIRREGNQCWRVLQFSSDSTVEDHVEWRAMEFVRFSIMPAANYPSGSLCISIESPEPCSLFLRFAYQTELGEGGGDCEDRAYVEYVKSAYHQSDLDMVQLIRTRAADVGNTCQ